jgi:hypothetical protein
MVSGAMIHILDFMKAVSGIWGGGTEHCDLTSLLLMFSKYEK